MLHKSQQSMSLPSALQNGFYWRKKRENWLQKSRSHASELEHTAFHKLTAQHELSDFPLTLDLFLRLFGLMHPLLSFSAFVGDPFMWVMQTKVYGWSSEAVPQRAAAGRTEACREWGMWRGPFGQHLHWCTSASVVWSRGVLPSIWQQTLTQMVIYHLLKNLSFLVGGDLMREDGEIPR